MLSEASRVKELLVMLSACFKIHTWKRQCRVTLACMFQIYKLKSLYLSFGLEDTLELDSVSFQSATPLLSAWPKRNITLHCYESHILHSKIKEREREGKKEQTHFHSLKVKWEKYSALKCMSSHESLKETSTFDSVNLLNELWRSCLVSSTCAVTDWFCKPWSLDGREVRGFLWCPSFPLPIHITPSPTTPAPSPLDLRHPAPPVGAEA